MCLSTENKSSQMGCIYAIFLLGRLIIHLHTYVGRRKQDLLPQSTCSEVGSSSHNLFKIPFAQPCYKLLETGKTQQSVSTQERQNLHPTVRALKGFLPMCSENNTGGNIWAFIGYMKARCSHFLLKLWLNPPELSGEQIFFSGETHNKSNAYQATDFNCEYESTINKTPNMIKKTLLVVSQASSRLSEVCRLCVLCCSVDSLPHAPGLKAFSTAWSDMEQFPKIPAGETEISDVPCLPSNVNLHFTNHRSS